MKLIARTNLLFTCNDKPGLVRTKAIRAGSTFECDEEQAKTLIAKREAVEKPKATRRASEFSQVSA